MILYAFPTLMDKLAVEGACSLLVECIVELGVPVDVG